MVCYWVVEFISCYCGLVDGIRVDDLVFWVVLLVGLCWVIMRMFY